MKGNLIALASGTLFAIGLAVGGMTQPAKVIGFLDFWGAWDPSLLMVMIGGLAVYAVGARLALRRRASLTGDAFEALPRQGIDRRLLAGSALFGVGWGIAGFCPGPAIVSIGPASLGALVFVGAMLAGQVLFEIFERRSVAAETEGTAPAPDLVCG